MPSQFPKLTDAQAREIWNRCPRGVTDPDLMNFIFAECCKALGIVPAERPTGEQLESVYMNAVKQKAPGGGFFSGLRGWNAIASLFPSWRQETPPEGVNLDKQLADEITAIASPKLNDEGTNIHYCIHTAVSELAARYRPKNRPTIVCLCGSTKFLRTFQAMEFQETLAGKIVLTIGCDSKSDDQLFRGPDAPAIKARLDELHKRKIDLADEVLILDVGGYIGSSTRSELEYAEAHGKKIRKLSVEQPNWKEPKQETPPVATMTVEQAGKTALAIARRINPDTEHSQWNPATFDYFVTQAYAELFHQPLLPDAPPPKEKTVEEIEHEMVNLVSQSNILMPTEWYRLRKELEDTRQLKGYRALEAARKREGGGT